jgi:hypothetical protein
MHSHSSVFEVFLVSQNYRKEQIMAMSRTWIGTINNDAGNPGNWSPNGAPQASDTLTDNVPGSTIDISGNVLRGDTLTSNAGATFNLSNQAVLNLNALPAGNPVVNVAGTDTLNVTTLGGAVPYTIHVNLDPNANLFGTFDLKTFVGATITGAAGSRVHCTATDIIRGANMVVDADVVGSGTFIVGAGPARGLPRASTLEFGGSVAHGAHVDVSGTQFGLASTLKIDHPTEFHATVALHDTSLVDLIGLAQANSWSYGNEILSIKDTGGKVIDTLKVADAASNGGSGLSVSKTAAGDVLVSSGTDFYGSLALPTS